MRRFTPLLLAGLSILTAVIQLVQSAQERVWTGRQEEMVTIWDARIQDVQETLPPGTDRIGYLETSDILESETFDIEEFLLMQYSLAPASLTRGLENEWVVGNFNNDVDVTSWLDERIIRYEIKSFGFGLYLIRILEP
jgi:hypothetical protein